MSSAQPYALLWISQTCNEGVSRAVFSSGGLTREEPASKFTQFVGRILCSCRIENTGFKLPIG